MMSRMVIKVMLVLSISLSCLFTEAQDKTMAYYNQHPSEILFDAQESFKNAKYERAEELSKWHFIIVGDDRADSLKEKAARCAEISARIVELRNAGKVEEAKSLSKELLALNPDDKLANELNNPGILKIISSPAGAKIWLNGKNTNKTTPDLLEDLTAGKYTIKLVLDGYEDYSGTIIIASGKRTELTQTLTLKEKPTTGSINGHEWVDLGLSVKWATCNVGASSPSEYGSYFAWGETRPKSEYTWSNLRYCADNTGDSFTKYNTDSRYGTVDNKKQLELADDAARQNWGGSWRMPTDAELTELREKCTWTWTTQGGKNGYRVTSKTNGSSIFLPAAGYRYEGSLSDVGSYGYFWSSSLYTDTPCSAWVMYFYSDGVLRLSGSRYYGQSVRPVSE